MDVQQDGLVTCRNKRCLLDEIYNCFRAVPRHLVSHADATAPHNATLRNDCFGWSLTDLTAPKFDFRFTPESGLKSDIGPCPGCAKGGSGQPDLLPADRP